MSFLPDLLKLFDKATAINNNPQIRIDELGIIAW